MDQSFFIRAHRMLGRGRPADCESLLAALEARQSESPTVRTARRLNGEPCPSGCGAALIDVLLAVEDGPPGAGNHAGCFSRAAARRRVNTA